MSCCENCDDKAPRDTTVFRWDFQPGTLSHICIKNVEGVKNLEIKHVVFMEQDGTIIHDSHYAKMHTSGSTVRVNIYRKKLPFDVLVASLNIDTVSGFTEDHLYGEPLQFYTISIVFGKDVEVRKDWLDLGNGAYRVVSERGMLDLVHSLGIGSAYVHDCIQLYRKHASGPVLVSYSEARALSLNTPDHPTWKNDALWQ